MIVVFLGPPGSGKGTQAKFLAEKMSVPHISLGDILREEVRAGSAIGVRVRTIMGAGKLVPDEITIELTRKCIERNDCRPGFILDGFPRSQAQAKALDRMLKENDRQIDRVVYFKISEAEVVRRLSARRSCRQCGAVYHLANNPPRQEGKCDICGGELYQRPDDNEAVIRTRFEVYEKSTRPLIERYAHAGKLLEIDAARPIEALSGQLLSEFALVH